MRFLKFYAIFSMFLGITETIDGIGLMMRGGKFNSFSLAVSLLEFFWLPLCIFVTIVYYRNKGTRLSALSFIGYSAFGYIVSWLDKTPPPQSLSDIRVPFGYLVIGTIFAVYFAIINFHLYRQIFRQGNPG